MYRQTVVRLNRDKYKKVSDTLLGLVLGEKFLYASFVVVVVFVCLFLAKARL